MSHKIDISTPTANGPFCNAAIDGAESPFRVNRVISSVRQPFPLLPQKPTFGCSAILLFFFRVATGIRPTRTPTVAAGRV